MKNGPIICPAANLSLTFQGNSPLISSAMLKAKERVTT